jgi:hypothetical protein
VSYAQTSPTKLSARLLDRPASAELEVQLEVRDEVENVGHPVRGLDTVSHLVEQGLLGLGDREVRADEPAG